MNAPRPTHRPAGPAIGGLARIDPARDRALRAIAAQCERWPALEPLPERAWDGLNDLDGAFAAALYDATLRRWLTLAWILEACAGRPLLGFDVPVRAAILGGAAQLFFLDRVPAHAAIDRSVEWAKEHTRGTGVVNAVLRKAARVRESATIDAGPWTGRPGEIPLADGRVMRPEAPGAFKTPPDEAAWIGAATSHPPALVRGWVDRHGPATTRAIAAHGIVPPPVVVCVGWATPKIEPGAPAPGLTLTPHRSPRHLVAQGPRPALASFLADRPGAWVQDAGSSAAVAGVADLAPRVVLDACAGRGTKTAQLAAVFPAATILATDVDPSRLAALRRRFEGHERVRVVEPGDVGRVCGRGADLVVLDVPCSNSGTLGRRVEARYRFGGREGPRQTARLVDLQRSIAREALGWAAPAAAVLYSTCSIEPAENQEQSDWAATELGVSVERSGSELPGGGPGDEPGAYQDGGGWALWRTARR